MPTCLACLCNLSGQVEIPMCVNCWEQMSPGERAMVAQAVETHLLLKDIRGQLESNSRSDANSTTQIGSVAKASEAMGRTIQGIRADLQAYLKWAQKNDKPWEGG